MTKGSVLREISDMVEAAVGNNIHALDSFKETAVNTGTTSLAIKLQDGVIVAADRQVSTNREIFDRNYRKITRISPFSVVTYAGTIALIQMVAEMLGGYMTRFANRNGRNLPMEAQAHLLKTILLQLTFRHRIYVASHFILAGYHPLDGPRVYMFDTIGGMYEKSELYQAVGSGSDFAQGALRALSRLGQEKKLGVYDAIEAINASGYFDLYTGEPTSLPLIFLIGKNGIQEIDAGVVIAARVQETGPGNTSSPPPPPITDTVKS